MTAETPEQNRGRAPEADTPVAANDAEPPANQPDAEPAEAAETAAAAPSGLEQEVADLKDRLLRAMAETENTRRRTTREIEDARRYATANMARDLLSVADNLRRALEAVPPEARGAQAELNSLMEGVELTERDLLKAFEKAGISPVDPIGEKLDPNLHQAMMQVDNTDAPDGTIVQVLAPGYMLHDRLLRAAMVAVAKGGAKAAPKPAPKPEGEPPVNGEGGAPDSGDPEAGDKVDTTA